MKIHIWCQSYAANPGGIQTFTRFVVRALGDLYPEAEIVAFAKNDQPSTAEKLTRGKLKLEGFGGWPRPLRALAFGLGVIRQGVRDVPTVIISTHVNFAPVAALLKRCAGPIPFCAIGHGIEVWDLPKTSLRKALRAADRLVAVSEFTRERMAQAIGVEPSRIEVLPNTFDSERFQPGPKPPALLQRYGLSAEQPIILTVARLAETEQYKGYDNVLLALPAVLQQFPDVRYVIVGEGPDRPRVEALSRHLRVADKVIFAGYVPNEELADHYNLCDVFAMPSKGEGFGIVFLEALSCGKAVIAGNKDGSAEAVLNGRLGVLVDPDDVGQIADAIIGKLKTEKLKAEIRGEGGEGSSQQSEIRGQRAEGKRPTPNEEETGGAEVAFESKRSTLNEEQEQGKGVIDFATLRHEVIGAYGFDRFRLRLGGILEKLKS